MRNIHTQRLHACTQHHKPQAHHKQKQCSAILIAMLTRASANCPSPPLPRAPAQPPTPTPPHPPAVVLNEKKAYLGKLQDTIAAQEAQLRALRAQLGDDDADR